MYISLWHQGNNIDRDAVRRLLGRPDPSPDDPPPPPRTPLPEALQRWIDDDASAQDKMDGIRGVFHHASDAWQRWDATPNVLLVHYSDLLGDLGGQMRGIAGALGFDVPEERWPALVEAATFAAMRDRAGVAAPDAGGVLKDPQAFFRQGTSGGWRDLMTAGAGGPTTSSARPSWRRPRSSPGCTADASGQAELVALGILHHDGVVVRLVDDLEQATSSCLEAGDLRGQDLVLAVPVGPWHPAHPDVEVQPVLRRLAFGDLVEEEPGTLALGVDCGVRVVVLILGESPGGERIRPRVEPRGWGFLDVAEGLDPELAQSLRVGAVQRDLDLVARRVSCSWCDGDFSSLAAPHRQSSTGSGWNDRRVPNSVPELLSLLELEQLEVDLYRGRQPDTAMQRVFGGQVAAQALRAASATVAEDRAVHSLHSYFLRPGDTAIPIIYDVERIRDGRSFATRRVWPGSMGSRSST